MSKPLSELLDGLHAAEALARVISTACRTASSDLLENSRSLAYGKIRRLYPCLRTALIKAGAILKDDKMNDLVAKRLRNKKKDQDATA